MNVVWLLCPNFFIIKILFILFLECSSEKMKMIVEVALTVSALLDEPMQVDSWTTFSDGKNKGVLCDTLCYI